MKESNQESLYFSIGTLSSGGAERVVSILVNKLINKDFDITIFLWIGSNVFYDIDKRVKIISIEKECGSKNILKKTLWFRSFIKNNPPSLILSFLAIFNILVLASLVGIRVKKVVCERNDPRYTPFWGWLRRVRNVIYYLADGVLTQTDNNKSYFSKRLQKKIKVIYNPILMDYDLVGSALWANKDNSIISVARLEPQKNQKMLIRAFSLFSLKHPTYKLVIYGKGKSHDELTKYIKDLNLEKKICLAGVTQDIFDKMKVADIFVLSSYFEGMPNTLLEAMCVGLPCISTKVSGAVDLIRDGENGYLVDIDDAYTMAEKMDTLATSKAHRNELGLNASGLYKKLNIDVIYKEWETYINEVIHS